MRALRRFLTRLIASVTWQRDEVRLREEVEEHLALQTAENIRAGLSPDEARRQAILKFGAVEAVKEDYRDQRQLPILEQLLQDIRYAVRGLQRNPSFATMATLTLAVGIAATTTAFTIVNTVLIRDLPFESPTSIVQVGIRRASDAAPLASYADFREWEESSRSFIALSAFEQTVMSIADDDLAPEQVEGTYISAGTFHVLKVQPILGRAFTPDDDRLGGAPVTILANHLWRERYAADPNILGKTIRVNARPVTVVGVMPNGFEFPIKTMVWTPLAMRPDITAQNRDSRFLEVIGRLDDSVTREAATAELNATNAVIARTHPDTNGKVQIEIQRFRPGIGTPWYVIFGALMTAVALLLLVSCANVGNLLSARSLQRIREVSIRASLGATRLRIVRQLLVESVVVSVGAGLLALPLSLASLRLFLTFVDESARPFWMDFSLDATVFMFFAAICGATGILFGMAPALHVSTTNANEALKVSSGRSVTTGRFARRFNAGLVVAQVIVTTVLVAGAISMMRHLAVESNVNNRINTAQLLVANLRLPAATYQTDKERAAFYQRLDDRLALLPGISSVTIASAPPFIDGARRELSLDGHLPSSGEQLPTIQLLRIGNRYFETLGLRPLSGRTLSEADDAPGRDSVVVNQRFAEQFFRDSDPIGRSFTLLTNGTSPQRVTIVGVVPNLRTTELTQTPSVVYLPYGLNPVPGLIVLARSNNHTATAAQLREEVRELDADLPLWDIRTLDEVISRLLWVNRVFGGIFAIFAGIAMAVAVVGIYGIVAYTMAQRTQEIGVRLALGASRSGVWWAMMRSKFAQVGIGIAIGSVLAFILLGLMGGLLVGRFGHDPFTFAATAGFLLIATLIAMFWPIWRATSGNPMTALRYE